MNFKIFGHENLLALHGNTIEFTKDKNLTKKGDCIVGVNANFDLSEIKKLKGECICKIKAKTLEDFFEFFVNPNFNDEHELVFRRSEFHSSRTLGFRITKAACDLNRNLIEHLKNPNNTAIVEIYAKDTE